MTEQQGSRVRASDSEREQVAAVLRDAMGEGRLTLAEGEERLAGVYAVTFRDELPAFTADLPEPSPTAQRGRRAGGPGEQPAGASGPGRRPGGRPGGWPGGWPGDRRQRGPGPGLAVLAIGAGIWAAFAGGPLWLAIVLGSLAVVALKHGCGPRPAGPGQPAAGGDDPAADPGAGPAPHWSGHQQRWGARWSA